MVRPTQVATILDPETYEAFAELADANERSLAAELRVAVKERLERTGSEREQAA